jgi:hypothetical protein
MNSQTTLAQARKMLAVGIKNNRDVTDDIETMIAASISIDAIKTSFAPDLLIPEQRAVNVRRAIGMEASRVASWMKCASWANPSDEPQA